MLKSEVKDFKFNRFMVKLTTKEQRILREKARRYTKGNASAWIRYSMQLEPKPTDLVKLQEDSES